MARSPTSRIVSWLASTAFLVAILMNCSRHREIVGHVVAVGSATPIPGATVTANWRGWGRGSDGRFVWDRDFTASGSTAPDGTFRLGYDGPRDVRLEVMADRYDRYERWWTARDSVVIRMLPIADSGAFVAIGTLSLGEAPDARAGGPFGGWIFRTSTPTADTSLADLVVTAFSPGPPARLVVRATGAGALRFVAASTLGADVEMLRRAGPPPADGWVRAAPLEPGTQQGVLYVRTRDGRDVATVEIAESMTEQAPSGGRRVALRYVYGGSGRAPRSAREADSTATIPP